MAATYLILAVDEVLSDPGLELPGCLHIERKWLYDRQPGVWVVQVRDDDAPPEFQAQHVDLIFEKRDGQPVRILDRKAVRF